MIFSSLDFFFFFLGFFLLHWLTADKYKIILLIIASLIFYGFWKISYVFLPVLLTYIAFIGTKWIHKSDNKTKKYKFITIVVLLVLPLLFFKYTNFIVNDIFGIIFDMKNIKILSNDLPLGISFITFTLIAYVVDIYTGKFRFVDKFKLTAVYTLFFPHLIAGPIMRPKELIPQFDNYSFANKKLLFGLLVFSFGLFKKIIFADQLGVVVEEVYNGEATSKLDYLVAFYAFPVQIYGDFSGYTDMAIGLALMLGIKFPNNFNRPYLAISFVDFWKRWHITLSKWIRDYIYIPLGGNRGGVFSQSKNLLITMSIAGLWHGASWTFVLWGVYHGIWIVLYHLAKYIKFLHYLKLLHRWVKIFLIFHLVSIGWIIFRSKDIEQFNTIFYSVFILPIEFSFENTVYNGNYIFLILIFFIFHKYDSIARFKWMYMKFNNKYLYVIISFLIFTSALFTTGSSAEFIYFDF